MELQGSALGKERAGGPRSAGVQRPGRGSPPERSRQRGGLPGARRRPEPGLGTKRGAGGAEPAPRARAPRTADPHDWERRFLRLIPTSMKTARAGPPAGPLSRLLAGQLQPGSLPLFVSPPAPHSALPTSAARTAASLPGFSPRALGRTKGGSAPNLGEGRINPGVCREGRGRGGQSKKGLRGVPPAWSAGVCKWEHRCGTGPVGAREQAGSACFLDSPSQPLAVSIQTALRARNSLDAPLGCPGTSSIHSPPGISSTVTSAPLSPILGTPSPTSVSSWASASHPTCIFSYSRDRSTQMPHSTLNFLVSKTEPIFFLPINLLTPLSHLGPS